MANEGDLPHRTWSVLRDLWLGHIPPDLSPSDIDPLSRVVDVAGRPVDKTPIELVPGLREQALTDALFIRLKSLYCIECATRSDEEGFPTWASMTMYDACFFGAKAFCYLLGLRDLSRDSNMYADIFYQEHKKGRVILDGHRPLQLKERLSHDMLWKIFARLVRTLTLDIGDYNDRIRELRRFDFSAFSRERNRILYKPYSWSRQDNIETSDVAQRLAYLNNIDFVKRDKKAEYFAEYYFLAIAVNNVISALIEDLGVFAPALLAEVRDRPRFRDLPSFLVN